MRGHRYAHQQAALHTYAGAHSENICDLFGRLHAGVHTRRGVFAAAPIAVGAVIEQAPVVIVPQKERPLLDQTILHDYYFQWSDGPEGEGPGAAGRS